MAYRFDYKLLTAYEQAVADCQQQFLQIDHNTAKNCEKIIKVLNNNKVRETDFYGSTGYGYGDTGRDKLDQIMADIMHVDAGIMRAQFTCGTHAISSVLFGNLRPGDELIAGSGMPYDTLHYVIGTAGKESNDGSLIDFGVEFNVCDLKEDGAIDIDKLCSMIKKNTKMVALQRSRGYSWRNALSIEQIGEAIKAVKAVRSDIICFVDNCYGTFTQEIEPTDVGADIVAGSLIKNAGGGIAPTGGYIAGSKEYVRKTAARLTAPGLDSHVGATLDTNRLLYQGLYFAPIVVGEALKTSTVAARLGEILGFSVMPDYKANRNDIVQSIMFDSADKLTAFCRGVQKGSAVDSDISPEPSDMAGYESKIIMASGSFIFGSSIEISCDAPLREPYIAYMQGGLNLHYSKYAILHAFQELIDEGLLKL